MHKNVSIPCAMWQGCPVKETVVVSARMELPRPGMDGPQTINPASNVLIRALLSARKEQHRELGEDVRSDLTYDSTGAVDF